MISQKTLVHQDFCISKKVINKAVGNLIFSLLFLVASVFAIRTYVLPYCNSYLMFAIINLFSGKRLGMFSNHLIPDFNRLEVLIPNLNAELYVEWAARLLKISAICIPVVLLLIIVDKSVLLLMKNNNSLLKVFYITDIALCVATNLSLVITAISIMHFTIMFVISIVILGDSLLWYSVIIGVSLLVTLFFVYIGIKVKIYRFKHLDDSRESLGSYIRGLIVCLLPAILSALTLIVVAIVVGIFVLLLIAFLTGGLGDETSRR